MNNNRALHEAISNEDMERFLQLLHQPDIDLNQENSKGNTLLTASIKRNNPVMAECLIEAGCDVNLRGNYYGGLPLHVAIKNNSLDIVHMLIKKGADINASSSFDYTPLHRAISNEDVEVISMLLYYEADVNVTDCQGRTPLMLSFFDRSRRNCQEVLLNYYDDFSCCDDSGNDALHLATDEGSPFVVDLVERGADVNTVDSWGRCLIYRTVNNNAEAFKCIWSRINHELLFIKTDNSFEPFFLYYLENCRITSNYEYLECLYLMLESPIAHLLIKDCIDYLVRRNNSLVYDLLKTLVSRKVLPEDRLSLIYACLSFGADINIDDLQYTYRHYGFNEEFKALLCAGNLICSDYAEQIRHCMKEDYYTKGFSWLSLEGKQHLISNAASYKRKRISKALAGIPEFPSLFDLGRNGEQKYIQKEFKIAKMYQFHDAVNCLKLPQLMKDIVLLEKPIYTNLVIFTNTSDDDDDDDADDDHDDDYDEISF